MKCPENVLTAVRLLYLSLVVEFTGAIPILSKELSYWKEHPATITDPAFSSTVYCFGFWIIMLAVMVLLIHKISKGVDTARVIFTTLFVLGIIQSLSTMLCMPIADGWGLITYSLKILAQGAATYLLFSKPAVVWFRKELAEDNSFETSQIESIGSPSNSRKVVDPAISSIARITTAVLGGFVFLLLIMFVCVFSALENCPGGDGYKSDGAINKSFSGITKMLNELNKR